jgi:PKD repeat protein
VFNGAVRNIYPNELLEQLAAIKARGGRIVLAMAGNEENFKDRDGHFNLSMWKARVDRFKGVDFSSYIEDGTIIGHYMIDEPNDPVNWTGKPVPGPTLEAMAAYSKQLWPRMATVIRVEPGYLATWGSIYRNVDAVWAQWSNRKGDPADYIRQQVADAGKLGLSLVTGMNIRKGGPEKTPLSASVVQSAGSALLASDYPCAFISWEYDESYLRRKDVQSAMENLSRKAGARGTRSCRRQGGGSAPPAPENRPPTALFSPPSCTAGVPCRFSDGSSDQDGEIEAWSWDFGDGSTSSDKNPSHVYRETDSYRVALTVTDDDGSEKTFSATVRVARAGRAPRPTISLSDCTAGQACRFSGGTERDGDDDEDGDGEDEEEEITNWSWSFGDGGTSTERNPTHTFATASNYIITLSVTNADGATASVTAQLTVAPGANQAPRAEFTAPSCTMGAPCQFTDGSSDSDGSIVSRSWSFGGNVSSAATNPVHTFETAGTYTVTLIVEDNAGGTSSTSRQVTVAPLTLPGNQTVALSGRVVIQQGRHMVRLTWSGAAGPVLDLYRNNQLRERTNNDGLYIRTIGGPSGTSLTYRVCERGSTRCSNDVTVTIEGSSIRLTATGRIRNGREEATLRWSGVGFSTVDVYRSSVRIARTSNDGLYVTSRARSGGTATFRVCERGTSNCSNSASVTF